MPLKKKEKKRKAQIKNIMGVIDVNNLVGEN
jgi:hypothetical protein